MNASKKKESGASSRTEVDKTKNNSDGEIPDFSHTEDIPFPPRSLIRNTGPTCGVTSSRRSSLSPPRRDSVSAGPIVSPAVDSKTAKCAPPWHQFVPGAQALEHFITTASSNPSVLPLSETSSPTTPTATANVQPHALSTEHSAPSVTSVPPKTGNTAAPKLVQGNHLATILEQRIVKPSGGDFKADTTYSIEGVTDDEVILSYAEGSDLQDREQLEKNQPITKALIVGKEHETPLHSLKRWMESLAEEVNIRNEKVSGDRGDEAGDEDDDELCFTSSSSFDSSSTMARSPSPYDESLAHALEVKGIGSSELTTGLDACHLTPGAGSPVDELFAIESVDSEGSEDDTDTKNSDNAKTMSHDEDSTLNKGRSRRAYSSGDASKSVLGGHCRPSRSSSVDHLLTHAVKGLLSRATVASEVNATTAKSSTTADHFSKAAAASATPSLPFANAGLAARTALRAEAGAAAQQTARAEAAADRAIKAAEASRSVVEGGRIAVVANPTPATPTLSRQGSLEAYSFASLTSPQLSAELEARCTITPRRRPSIASFATTNEPAESLLMRRGNVWNGVNWVSPTQYSSEPLLQQSPPPPTLSSSPSNTQQQQSRLSRSAERRSSNVFPVAPTTAAALAVAAATAPAASAPIATTSGAVFQSEGDRRRSEVSVSFPTRPAVRSAQPPPLWTKPPAIVQARPKPRRRQFLEAVLTGESQSAALANASAVVENTYYSESSVGTDVYRRNRSQSEPLQFIQGTSNRSVPMRRMASRDLVIAQPEEKCGKSFAERRRALRHYENGEQAVYLASLQVPASTLVLPSKVRAESGVNTDDKDHGQNDTKSLVNAPAASTELTSSSARRKSFAASTEAAASALADVVAALAATAAYEPEAEAVAEAARAAAAARDDEIPLPKSNVEVVVAEAVAPVKAETKKDRQTNALTTPSDKAQSATGSKAMPSDTGASPKRTARNTPTAITPKSPPQPPTSPLTRPCLRARTLNPAPLLPMFKARSQSMNSPEDQSKPMAVSLRGRRAASPAARERQSRRREPVHAPSSGGPTSTNPTVRLRSRSASPLRVSAASSAALATAAPLVFGDNWKEAKRAAEKSKAAGLQGDIRRRREHAFQCRTQTTRPRVVNPSGLNREGPSSSEDTRSNVPCSRDACSKQSAVNANSFSTARQPRSQSAPRMCTTNSSSSRNRNRNSNSSYSNSSYSNSSYSYSNSRNSNSSYNNSSNRSGGESSAKPFAVAHALPASPLRQHNSIPRQEVTASNFVESRRTFLAVDTSPSELLWNGIETSTSSVSGESVVLPQRVEARRMPFFAETLSPLSAASVSSSISTPRTVATPSSHMGALTS